LTRFSRRLAILVAALSLALSIGAVAAANAAPQAYTAETGGCCVCRGTEGGDATTIRSCTDGSKVDSCTSQCKAQNADSMAFGYNQTCSQGCAGFPTQNLH
jgi:hypothetical protein